MASLRKQSRYYRVSTGLDGTVIVEARHPKAKQVVWGWAGDYGSTKDPGAIELYGNENGTYTGDWTDWRWKLSPAGVASLTKSLRLELAEPVRFESTAFDQRRCRELLDLVTTADRSFRETRRVEA